MFKESFLLFGRLFPLRSILLFPSELYARHFIIKLSEFLVLFDVGGRLVGKRTNELIHLELPRRHLLIQLEKPSLGHHLVYCLFELC